MFIKIIFIVLSTLLFTFCTNIGSERTRIMHLTVEEINNIESDSLLNARITEEMNYYCKMRNDESLDDYVERIDSIPVGYKAFALTYELEVSMYLDDIGCHFNNWHSKKYAMATLWALGEMDAIDEASEFKSAIKVAFNNWEYFSSDSFSTNYLGSEVEKQFIPINNKLWSLILESDGGKPITSRWVEYARKKPERLCNTRENNF